MGGRVSNIGAARRFPRWEGHWKTPTDQPMAAGSRSECTRRESAAKRSAIWDWMAGETRCEHSCWEFLAMVAMRTKGQLGNANFSSFSWRSEPVASTHVRGFPSACLRRRGNRFAVPRILMGKSSKRRISRPRAHGDVAGPQGATGPILSPLIFSLKAMVPGFGRSGKPWAWLQLQKVRPVCTHGAKFPTGEGVRPSGGRRNVRKVIPRVHTAWDFRQVCPRGEVDV